MPYVAYWVVFSCVFTRSRQHPRFVFAGCYFFFFFFSSRRRHTRFKCDWSSDVCSSDLAEFKFPIKLRFFSAVFCFFGSFCLVSWAGYRSYDQRRLFSTALIGGGILLGLLGCILILTPWGSPLSLPSLTNEQYTRHHAVSHHTPSLY